MSPDQQLAERVVAHMMAHDAYSQWLGIEVVAVAPGQAVLRMAVRSEMLNGFRVGHGGIAFALADSALAFAANTYGRVAVGIENSIVYPHPVHAGDVLTARAEEVAAANRVATYDVTLTRADGTKVGLLRGTVYRTRKAHFDE